MIANSVSACSPYKFTVFLLMATLPSDLCFLALISKLCDHSSLYPLDLRYQGSILCHNSDKNHYKFIFEESTTWVISTLLLSESESGCYNNSVWQVLEDWEIQRVGAKVGCGQRTTDRWDREKSPRRRLEDILLSHSKAGTPGCLKIPSVMQVWLVKSLSLQW